MRRSFGAIGRQTVTEWLWQRPGRMGRSASRFAAGRGVQTRFRAYGGPFFIDFIHRRTDDAEIYFLANRRDIPELLRCTFRVDGWQPELWDPVTGATAR